MAATYIKYKGCIILVKNSTLKQRVLKEFNSSPMTGHSGFHKTYERDKHSFFWDIMKIDIRDFVAIL
jgi:hypothetical protein